VTRRSILEYGQALRSRYLGASKEGKGKNWRSDVNSGRQSTAGRNAYARYGFMFRIVLMLPVSLWQQNVQERRGKAQDRE